MSQNNDALNGRMFLPSWWLRSFLNAHDKSLVFEDYQDNQLYLLPQYQTDELTFLVPLLRELHCHLFREGRKAKFTLDSMSFKRHSESLGSHRFQSMRILSLMSTLKFSFRNKDIWNSLPLFSSEMIFENENEHGRIQKWEWEVNPLSIDLVFGYCCPFMTFLRDLKVKMPKSLFKEGKEFFVPCVQGVWSDFRGIDAVFLARTLFQMYSNAELEKTQPGVLNLQSFFDTSNFGLGALKKKFERNIEKLVHFGLLTKFDSPSGFEQDSRVNPISLEYKPKNFSAEVSKHQRDLNILLSEFHLSSEGYLSLINPYIARNDHLIKTIVDYSKAILKNHPNELGLIKWSGSLNKNFSSLILFGEWVLRSMSHDQTLHPKMRSLIEQKNPMKDFESYKKAYLELDEAKEYLTDTIRESLEEEKSFSFVFTPSSKLSKRQYSGENVSKNGDSFENQPLSQEKEHLETVNRINSWQKGNQQAYSDLYKSYLASLDPSHRALIATLKRQMSPAIFQQHMSGRLADFYLGQNRDITLS